MAKQSFQVGSTVKIGFMTGLKVVEKIPTPGDYAPDCYALLSAKGQWYRFTPHNGIVKCDSLADARSY